jgi:tyrosinase
MAARVRRDVQSLIDEGDAGLAVLADYARAIEKMQALDSGQGDPTDPRSWRFQAAIHGYPELEASKDHPRRWGSCRHDSWFFLAWHRMYLLFFERMVQFHLGDPSWALPYWDYTKVEDEAARILPEPFRTPTVGNALHVPQRRALVNHPVSPVPIPAHWCDARDALKLANFALGPGEVDPAFAGGVVDDVAPNMGARGALEDTPHGQVHVAVGGRNPDGFMSQFARAGLDPIFWLHHCNLDRLWDVWIGVHGASAMPSETAFLDTTFDFFDADGDMVSMAIRDVLVSDDLGYAYESTAPPVGTPVPELVAGLTGAEGAGMGTPELVGATTDVSLGRRTTVDIPLAAAVAGIAPEAAPSRWLLRVEDVTGTNPATPAYEVYLNVPPDERPADHPNRRAGTIASFGIPEASRPDAEHGGVGITDVFDITQVVQTLKDEDGGIDAIAVTIVPADLDGEAEDGGDVHAGRVSLYAG